MPARIAAGRLPTAAECAGHCEDWTRAAPDTCVEYEVPGRAGDGKHELIALVTKYGVTSRKATGRSMIKLGHISGIA